MFFLCYVNQNEALVVDLSVIGINGTTCWSTYFSKQRHVLQICSPVLYYDLCIKNRLCIIFIYSALSAPVGTTCRVGACSTHASLQGQCTHHIFLLPEPHYKSTYSDWRMSLNGTDITSDLVTHESQQNYYLMKMQFQTALIHYIKITKLRYGSCLRLHSLAWKTLGHAKVRDDGAPPRSTG